MAVMELIPVLESKNKIASLRRLEVGVNLDLDENKDKANLMNISDTEIIPLVTHDILNSPNCAQVVETLPQPIGSKLHSQDNLQPDEQCNVECKIDYLYINNMKNNEYVSPENSNILSSRIRNCNNLEKEVSSNSIVQTNNQSFPEQIYSKMKMMEPNEKPAIFQPNKTKNMLKEANEKYKFGNANLKRRSFLQEEKLDLVELRKPLEQGFVREVVYRMISTSTNCDIYYRPLQGPKLRSRNDVVKYLEKTMSSFNLKNFSFNRISLGFGEPFEVVRNADGFRGRHTLNSLKVHTDDKLDQVKLSSPKQTSCIKKTTDKSTTVVSKGISKIMDKIKIVLNKDDNQYHIKKQRYESASISGNISTKKRCLSSSQTLNGTVIAQEELDECVDKLKIVTKNWQQKSTKYQNKLSLPKKRKLIKNDSNSSDAITKSIKLATALSFKKKKKLKSKNSSNFNVVPVEKEHFDKKSLACGNFRTFSKHSHSQSKKTYPLVGLSENNSLEKKILNSGENAVQNGKASYNDNCLEEYSNAKKNLKLGGSVPASNLGTKDPLMPAMQHFVDVMDEVKANNPTLKNYEISRIIDCMWRNLDTEKKKKYEEDYIQQMLIYRTSAENQSHEYLRKEIINGGHSSEENCNSHKATSNLTEMITNTNDDGKDERKTNDHYLKNSSTCIPVFQMSVSDYSEIGLTGDNKNENVQQEKIIIENNNSCNSVVMEIPTTVVAPSFPEKARIRVRPMEELFGKPLEKECYGKNIGEIACTSSTTSVKSSETVKSSPKIVFAPTFSLQNTVPFSGTTVNSSQASPVISTCQVPKLSMTASTVTNSSKFCNRQTPISFLIPSNKLSNFQKSQPNPLISVNNSNAIQSQCQTYVTSKSNIQTQERLPNCLFSSYSPASALRNFRIQQPLSKLPVTTSNDIINQKSSLQALSFDSNFVGNFQSSPNTNSQHDLTNSVISTSPNTFCHKPINANFLPTTQSNHVPYVTNSSVIPSVMQASSNSHSLSDHAVMSLPITTSTYNGLPSSISARPSPQVRSTNSLPTSDSSYNAVFASFAQNNLNSQNAQRYSLMIPDVPMIQQQASGSNLPVVQQQTTRLPNVPKVQQQTIIPNASMTQQQATLLPNVSVLYQQTIVPNVSMTHRQATLIPNVPVTLQKLNLSKSLTKAVPLEPNLADTVSPLSPLIVPPPQNTKLTSQAIDDKNIHRIQGTKTTPQINSSSISIASKNNNNLNNVNSIASNNLQIGPNSSSYAFKPTISSAITKSTTAIPSILSKTSRNVALKKSRNTLRNKHAGITISSSKFKNLNTSDTSNSQFTCNSSKIIKAFENKLRSQVGQKSATKTDLFKNSTSRPVQFKNVGKKKLSVIASASLTDISTSLCGSTSKIAKVPLTVSSSATTLTTCNVSTSMKHYSAKKLNKHVDVSPSWPFFSSAFSPCDNFDNQLCWPTNSSGDKFSKEISWSHQREIISNKLSPFQLGIDFSNKNPIPSIFSDSPQENSLPADSKMVELNNFTSTANNMEIEDDRSPSPPLAIISEVISLKDKNFDNIFVDEEVTSTNLNLLESSQILSIASAADDISFICSKPSNVNAPIQRISTKLTNTCTSTPIVSSQAFVSSTLPSFKVSPCINSLETNKSRDSDIGNIFLVSLNISSLKGYESVFSHSNVFAVIMLVDSETGQLLAIRTEKDGDQVYVPATGTVLFSGSRVNDKFSGVRILNLKLNDSQLCSVLPIQDHSSPITSSSESSFSTSLTSTNRKTTLKESQPLSNFLSNPIFKKIQLPESINAVETPYS